jgi:hypothetical protein
LTVNLLDRRSNLLVANIDALCDSIRRVRAHCRADPQVEAECASLFRPALALIGRA